MDIGRNIKEKMKEKNTKQIVLAEILNCSQAYVSMVLTGEKTPTVYTLKKLADYFGCTVDELLKDR